MAQGKWKREPITCIPVMQIADCYLNDDGVFDTSKYPDCNLFGDHNIADFLNLRTDKFKDAREVGSCWHLHLIKNDEGKITGSTTHTNSATWGYEKNYKPAAKKRMLAGK